MSMRGSVDQLGVTGAAGWIFDTAEGRPLVVQALLNGRIIGEAVAELHRADLAAAGFGDGRCGFDILFSDPVDPAALAFVEVKPQGGDVVLPRTNMTGYGDYFRSVFARHPGAGRPRSIFGGLWIDRTDAPRVLQGRIAAGATPAELGNTLRALVGNGHVLLRSALAPVGFDAAACALIDSLDAGVPLDPRTDASARRLLEDLPGVIFRDVALRVLRAVLDDNPRAYRTMLSRGQPGGFTQASAAEALTSPAECMAIVTCAGAEPILLDVIRESHRLPEFTAAGQSRWLAPGGAAGVEMAVSEERALEQVEIGPNDIALIGPGTLYRLHAPAGSTAVTTWCAPARVSPVGAAASTEGAFTVRHFSDALLMVC